MGEKEFYALGEMLEFLTQNDEELFFQDKMRDLCKPSVLL